MYWFVWMGNPGLWCCHLTLFLDLKLCHPCILVLKVQLCLPLYRFHSLMESSLWKKASIYSYYFQKILITTYICPPYTVWHTRISHDGHRRCNTVGVHVPKFKVKKWTSTPIPTHWTHDIRVKGIFLSGGKKVFLPAELVFHGQRITSPLWGTWICWLLCPQSVV